MKPAPFDYQAPATLRKAIDLLASNPDAAVIAGGQSLMPVLAFRLATPSLLVDLRRLPGLGNIILGDDGLRLGALVRWRDIEDDQRLVASHPLLRAAIAHVAHYQIRNRGTVGGSLAHADPAAELPGVAVTCEGEITLFGPAGSRTVRAADFFTGPLSTLRQPDEIVTELYLPKWPSGRRWAFQKYARRQGDFALAGILLLYDEDRRGALSNTHVGVIGACSRPHRLTRAETLLNGHAIDDGLIRRAAATAAEEVDPPDDLHGDAAYRRGLVATLIERALRTATQQGSARCG
jgi:carbon-monoxide dehydrogenase medium subunit